MLSNIDWVWGSWLIDIIRWPAEYRAELWKTHQQEIFIDAAFQVLFLVLVGLSAWFAVYVARRK